MKNKDQLIKPLEIEWVGDSMPSFSAFKVTVNYRGGRVYKNSPLLGD